MNLWQLSLYNQAFTLLFTIDNGIDESHFACSFLMHR